MGLFDSFFGKEEVNQLKRELAEKTGWITRLESVISELIAWQRTLSYKLRAGLENAVSKPAWIGYGIWNG